MKSNRLEQLFLKAIELPNPAAQRHFVEAETAGDFALREELLKLLEYHAESDSNGFLEVPLLEQDPSLASLGKTTTGVGEESQALEKLLGSATSSAPLGHVGHFALLEVLGKGGSAIVYRARDTKLAREVAVKLLLPSLNTNQQARERFMSEARAIAAIRHPNVVSIYEVGEQQGVPFLVMEYLPAGSLQSRIASAGPLTPAECMAVSSQLAAALEVAHATGLHHRDVKPSNVLIDTWPASIKLGDFGLASPKMGGTFGSRGGTPQYAAPEQLRGEPVDERTDLFGLGCTMYAMLNGRSPFSSGSRLQMINLTLNSQPAELTGQVKELPTRLEQLVRRLLEKNPDHRPASARVVIDELDAIKTAPAGLSRRGMIGTGAAALLAIAGLGWYQSKPIAEPQQSLLPGRRYYYYLSDKNLGIYLHQAENLVCVFGEGKPGPTAKPLSYWRVAQPGNWGSVTYRFPFAQPLQVCRLFAHCYCTFGLDPAAKMRLQISPDGTNWTLVSFLSRGKSEQYFLSDQPVAEIRPQHERETISTGEIIFINAGIPRNKVPNNGILNWPNGEQSPQLFVRAELYAERELFADDGTSLGPAAAQFLRHRPEYQYGPLFIDYDAASG